MKSEFLNKNTMINNYLEIIKHEMLVESLETIDRNFIKEIVLRAGGKVSDIDIILKHPSVKEINEDLFYINK
ncbi:hypothetical protein ED312_03765 [Sinomicrobium pectinilyticum]|uniref:Uncharacterized protein n=2 Tax=Sinomicrobium pectinilyticum TaxID=1084421 RepID=A0A3N0EX59_SINP1|nr:hypothetical protein ED312_03765 [Sinomicrobium pectinilyticum]